MKKMDKILILAVLVIACAAGLIFYMNRSKGSFVRVTVGTAEYGRYYLSEDQVIEINGTNTLEIKDGKAVMIDAKCPDHICMHMPAISQVTESIVCLPNQIIAEVKDE